jgi:hypothetical protein
MWVMQESQHEVVHREFGQQAARGTIRTALHQDLQGIKTTGMRPYLGDQELHFLHVWLIAMGVK